MKYLLFASLFALTQCSIEGSSVVGRLPTNRCTTDADCPDGRCEASRHLCVAAARTEVLFTATPPSGMSSETAFPTVTAPTSITSGDTVDIQLRPPRTLYGTIDVPGDDPSNSGRPGPSVRIPATVQLIPVGVSDFISTIETVASNTLYAPINDDRTGYTYSVLVPPATYDVVVRPAASLSDRIPPRFEHGFEVRADRAVQRLDLTFPREYSRWEGVVVDRTGHPIPGLTLRCIDPARDSLTVSSVATTRGADSDPLSPGSFGINISPGAPDTWTLRITSSPIDQAFFTVDIPRAALEASGYTSRALRIELPTEITSALSPSPLASARACTGCVAVTATVEARAGNGVTRPLRNAAVTLHSDVPITVHSTEVRAWYQARVQTAADGSFTANLIPGSYNVFISPPTTDFAAFVQRDFRVSRELQRQMGQVFTLHPRISVDGRVLSPQGGAARNARVTAIPFADAYVSHSCLDDPDRRDLRSRARTGEFSTRDDGSFVLDLDPGLYRLVVEPGERSGFPVTLSDALCVSSAVHGFNITLDTPVEVHGTIRDATGRQLPGATVESNLRVAEPGARGVVVPVAHTTANTQGTYRLLLPSSATR